MDRNYFPGRNVPEEQRFSQDNNPSQVSRDIYSVSYSNTSPPCEANGHIIEDHSSSVIPGDRSSGSGVSAGGASAGSSSLPHVTGSTVPPVTSSKSQESRLISRTTSQSKTQQTKTVTKTIVSRETRFVGIDGEPIDNPFNPYGTIESTVGNNGDHYSHYDPNQSAGYPIEYQGQSYPTVEYHNYQDYPLSPPTPTSALNDSPTSARRGPSSVAIPSSMISNGPPASGYDELDTTLQYAQFNPENNPYGYAGIRSQQQQVVMYGSQQPPQGYLDNRPSFDDSDLYRSNPAATVPLTTVRWPNKYFGSPWMEESGTT